MVIVSHNPIALLVLYGVVILTYMLFRNYFSKNIKSNYKTIIKRLKLLMIINGVLCVFTIFTLLIYKNDSVKFTGNIIRMLFDTKLYDDYKFRIIAIILFAIMFVIYIFVIIKDAYKIVPICILIGIVANIMIFIDTKGFSWYFFTKSTLQLATGVFFLLFFIIEYGLFIFFDKKVKALD